MQSFHSDNGGGRARSRLKIMETLIGKGPMTRGELAGLSGMAAGTLTDLLGALKAEKLILTQKAKTAGAGRPAEILSVNAGLGHVIGIKISMHEATLALTDFSGRVLATRKLAHVAGSLDAVASGKTIGLAAKEMLAQMEVPRAGVAGIGVGLPGFIESHAGKCLWSPVFPAGGNEFAATLREATGLSVLIENDVNLVTLAERWARHGRNCDDFMVITLEHGLGMGLFLNGELYSGANGLAAEFGHMIVEPDGAPCRCGRRGCLEAYVNDGAIAGRACLLMGKPSPRDDAAINEMVKAATELALAGDSQLRWIFAAAGTRLGRAAANMANVLAPRRVIVTGEAMRAEDLLMRPFTDAFSETLLPVLAARTELVWHKTGDEIWAQGAAARVLSHRFAGKS